MSRCWCEGKCAICEIGDVMDHRCDHCDVEFCHHCHGVINDQSGIIEPCDCDLEYFE